MKSRNFRKRYNKRTKKFFGGDPLIYNEMTKEFSFLLDPVIQPITLTPFFFSNPHDGLL